MYLFAAANKAHDGTCVTGGTLPQIHALSDRSDNVTSSWLLC
jgi:hypothetical protein